MQNKYLIGLGFKNCTHLLFWGWPNLCLSLVVDGSTFFVRFFNPTFFFLFKSVLCALLLLTLFFLLKDEI